MAFQSHSHSDLIPTLIQATRQKSKLQTSNFKMESKDDHSCSSECTEQLSLTSSGTASFDGLNSSPRGSSLSEQFPPSFGLTNFVPSFFLCPITNSIMMDPVIDKEGHTFERGAILRWLVLYGRYSPVTGRELNVEDLKTDSIVKRAIEKARKDAWARYIMDGEAKNTHMVTDKESSCSSPLENTHEFVNSPMSKNDRNRKNSHALDCIGMLHSTTHAILPRQYGTKLPPLPLSVDSPSRKFPKPTCNIPPPPLRSTRNDRSTPSQHSHSSATSSSTPVSPSINIPPTISSNASACSNLSFGLSHNGWAVQIGVHKVVCSSPGLCVTTDVHRRSTPVQRKYLDINGNIRIKDWILLPGSYVEILETQVHGGRVRGRIQLQESEIDVSGECKKKKRKSRIFQRGRKSKQEEEKEEKMILYSGWVSLQWAEEGEDERVVRETQSKQGISDVDHKITDEDDGPWTVPIPLGVYRINFGAGLPLRETPERDSAILGKLERGRCVEVVETQVRGDRVRARCIVPPMPTTENASGSSTGSFQSGWISLLNAMTGASGAQPVPLGAYVAVAQSGCVITEGGRLDSKVKSTLVPGSCIEVVATRIEEGVVRGLIAAGGHVTLFVPMARETTETQKYGGRMFAMPVPLGTYQIIQNGLEVTIGISSSSPTSVKLKLDACAEIVETRVDDGRVRGRLSAIGYGGVSKEAKGWINLFEPNCRWAKIVCFQGGRPAVHQE